MRKIAILASGRGSNMQAIAEAVKSGQINAKIEVVISDNREAQVLMRAKEAGIMAACFLPENFASREEYCEHLGRYLKGLNVDLVLLAGYLRLLTPDFLALFPDSVVNTHPALLPAFPGLNAQKQALDHGVKVAGCTIHFVDEGMDSGPIIAQSAVPVLPDDTEESLSDRILLEEHKLYVQAVADIAADKLQIVGRKVIKKTEE